MCTNTHMLTRWVRSLLPALNEKLWDLCPPQSGLKVQQWQQQPQSCPDGVSGPAGDMVPWGHMGPRPWEGSGHTRPVNPQTRTQTQWSWHLLETGSARQMWAGGGAGCKLKRLSLQAKDAEGIPYVWCSWQHLDWWAEAREASREALLFRAQCCPSPSLPSGSPCDD